MPSIFDLNDVGDMNIVRSAYDIIHGKGSFYKSYRNDSFPSLQKDMQSLTESYNELANFRYRAMTRQLHDFEKEYVKKQCNAKQLAYIEQTKNLLTTREREMIANEVKEEDQKNKEFWSKVKGGK